MTVKEILNVFKENDFADRKELAEAAGVSPTSLSNMIKRNDMKLSVLLKIVNAEGYNLKLYDGLKSYTVND